MGPCLTTLSVSDEHLDVGKGKQKRDEGQDESIDVQLSVENNQDSSQALMLEFNAPMVQSLVDKSQHDETTKHVNGVTALMQASGDGNRNLVEQILLAKGTLDVNLQSEAGETALMLAAYHGHHSVVQLLVNHQADLNVPNNAGITMYEITREYHP